MVTTAEADGPVHSTLFRFRGAASNVCVQARMESSLALHPPDLSGNLTACGVPRLHNGR